MNLKFKRTILMCCLAWVLDLSAADRGPVNLIEGDSSAETEVKSVTTGTWGITPSMEWDDSTAFDGKRSVKIMRYPGCPNLKWYFSPGTASVNDVKNLKFGQTYTYSFYARSDKEGTKALIGGAQFKWKQWFPEKTIILGKEWKRYTLSFVPEKNFKSDDDNRYCMFYGLKEDGVAWFDAFQLEEGPVATEYRNSTPVAMGLIVRTKDKNTFLADEKKFIDINVRKAQHDCPAALTLKYVIEDYTGRKVDEGTSATIFDHDGFWKYTIDFNPGRLGYYLVRAELLDGDKTLAKSLSSLVIVNPPVELAKGIEPWCGVCDPVNTRFFLSPLKKIGVKWIDAEVSWRDIETKKGSYDWNAGPAPLDSILQNAHKNGMKVKLYFGRDCPEWSLDPKEKAEAEKLSKDCAKRLFCGEAHLGDWRQFVRAVTNKYKDDVDLYEIYGEADAFYGLNPYYQKKYAASMIQRFAGGATLDIYANIIKAGAEEIRAQVPDALIGAVRPSDCDVASYNNTFPYTAEIIKRTSSKDFNVLPLDPYARPRYIGDEYPVSGDPLELRNVYNGAKKVVKEYGDKQKQIYISEQGYAIDHREIYNPKYTGEQIRCLVQSYLVARAVGYSSYFWFCVQMDPNSLEGNLYYYGMWYKDEPLPEVAAYSAVAGIVENVTEARLLDLNDNVKAAVYRKADGKAVAAVWTTANSSGITFDNSLASFDVMGNPVTPASKSGKAHLALGSFPVYMWKSGTGDNFNQLLDIVGKAELDVKSPADVYFRAADDKTGKMYLFSQLRNQPLSGKIDYSVDGRKGKADYDITPAGKCIVDIDISGKNTNGRILDAEIKFGGDFKNEKMSFEIPEFIYVQQLKSNAVPDADPAKWGVEPVIAMEDRSFIFPPDPHTPWDGNDDLSAKIYLGWADSYLYLKAVVKDDQHFAKERTNLYNGDCLQFAFDPKNDASLMKADGYASDDIELGMGLPPSGPAVECYKCENTKIWENTQYSVVRDEKSKTTVYSARFPLSSLGIVPGKAFGFNTVVFDDDTGTGQSYYMQFTRGITEKKNPKLFRKFILK